MHARRLHLDVPEDVLAERRKAMAARERPWEPASERPRKVSAALKAYALMARSATYGGVRDVSLVQRRHD